MRFLEPRSPAGRARLVLAATGVAAAGWVVSPPSFPANGGLKPHPSAGRVTSPACAGADVPVAPADLVVGMSEDGSLGQPVGDILVTSAGPMRRLDVTEVRGTYPSRRPDSRGSGARPTFASNAIHPDVPWYVCSSGADSTMRMSPSWALSSSIEEVTDPHFIPPYDNYYPETLYTEGEQNQYWAGWYDEENDAWVGEWIPITAGTWGPIFNEGTATRAHQYGMVLHGYLAIVVYRPDAIKIGPTCYEGLNGGVAVWAPPIKTCDTPIANR